MRSGSCTAICQFSKSTDELVSNAERGRDQEHEQHAYARQVRTPPKPACRALVHECCGLGSACRDPGPDRAQSRATQVWSSRYQ
jgi:hypothetical protein